MSKLLNCLVVAGLLSLPCAADSVRITLPAGGSWVVTNVAQATTATSQLQIVFQNAALAAGKSLRISVRARSTTLSGSGGSSIPVSAVSWSAAGATGGTGYGGTLSNATFTPVYVSAANPSSGGVTLTLVLMIPAGAIRAVNHSVDLEWQLESV